MNRLLSCFYRSLWIATILFPLHLSAQSPPIIDVTKGYQPLPIAIVPFETQGRIDPKLKDDLHTVLEHDLDFSNYFHLLPNRGQIEQIEKLDRKTDKVNHSSWREIGADAVVKGRIGQDGSGDITLEFSLYYCKGESRIAEKKFRPVKSERFRELVHYISDQIVFHLTGNPGIAQTRFAFIYEVLEGGKTIRELYLIDYDGHPSSLLRLTKDRDLVTMPAWSPDGKKIAFTSYFNKNPDLHIVDLQTGSRKAISKYPGLNSAPTWNPNGKDMVLVLSKDGNSELYRLNLSNGQITRLTFSRSIESSPCYSPDGKKIAYTSDRLGNVQLYTMNADGQGSRRISPGKGWFDLASWSPWGELIAYVGSFDTNRHFDIYIAQSDGTNTNKITQNTGNSESPCWSPDGRHLVFSSNRDGNWNLYTMDRQGGNLRRVTFLPGNCFSPDWSPVLD